MNKGEKIINFKRHLHNELTERLLPRYTIGKGIKKLRDPQLNTKGRVVVLFGLLGYLLPRDAVCKIRSICKNKSLDKLPFREEYLRGNKQIGEGWFSDVHLLESTTREGRSFVVKIEFCWDNCDVDSAVKIARKNKEEFEYLRQHYQNVKGLIPEEYSLIASASKDDKPTILTVQPFVGYDIIDIFNKSTKRMLIKELQNNSELREVFLGFVKATVDLFAQGKLIDLYGDKNIVLVKNQDNNKELKFLDPHLVRKLNDLERSTNPKDKNVLKVILKRMYYMIDIYNLVKSEEYKLLNLNHVSQSN